MSTASVRVLRAQRTDIFSGCQDVCRRSLSRRESVLKSSLTTGCLPVLSKQLHPSRAQVCAVSGGHARLTVLKARGCRDLAWPMPASSAALVQELIVVDATPSVARGCSFPPQ
jgi:hypothetical protein